MDTAIRMIPMPVRNRPRLPGLHVQKKARLEETNKTEPEEITRYLRGCVGPTSRLFRHRCVGPAARAPGLQASSCAGRRDPLACPRGVAAA